MALALSLSLDLFLMKGNLFIAVRVQPETDRQTDKGERATEQARGRWEKRKQKKKGGQNRGMWLTFSESVRGDAERELSPWTLKWTTDNNAIDITTTI